MKLLGSSDVACECHSVGTLVERNSHVSHATASGMMHDKASNIWADEVNVGTIWAGPVPSGSVPSRSVLSGRGQSLSIGISRVPLGICSDSGEQSTPSSV